MIISIVIKLSNNTNLLLCQVFITEKYQQQKRRIGVRRIRGESGSRRLLIFVSWIPAFAGIQEYILVDVRLTPHQASGLRVRYPGVINERHPEIVWRTVIFPPVVIWL